MTEMLFRENAYLSQATAQVVGVAGEGGIVLDRTVFYAASGGQPGDTGTLVLAGGADLAVLDTVHPGGDKSRIVHLVAPEARLPMPGEAVSLGIDWARRLKLMRMHTALHLLSVVFPFPVTGGSVGTDKGRLDFDMPEVPDDLAAREVALNRLVHQDHPVAAEWIEEDELDRRPELVKTLSVSPPRGEGRVRLVRIGAREETVDLQPCGGTHVASTGEIGRLRLGKIEKKGRQNRRIHLHFA